MLKPTPPHLAALLALAALGVGPIVHAGGGAGFEGRVASDAQLHAGVSLDQAIQMVERQYQAKVVKASVAEDNGRRVYVLRLLSEQGRVWTVRVDAASGATM